MDRERKRKRKRKRKREREREREREKERERERKREKCCVLSKSELKFSECGESNMASEVDRMTTMTTSCQGYKTFFPSLKIS